MKESKKGVVTEYKQGHHYLTHTEWEDGHCEIEVHRCMPELLFHTCDIEELSKAMDTFKNFAKNERKLLEDQS